MIDEPEQPTRDPREKCLRFADEAEAIAVLAAFRYTDEDTLTEHWSTGSPTHCLVNVGLLIDSIDYTDPESPAISYLPGWHIDMRVSDLSQYPAGIEAYEVFPHNRKHVFL